MALYSNYSNVYVLATTYVTFREATKLSETGLKLIARK